MSGGYRLTVGTQIAREQLPYEAALGAPRVEDAARQRGAVALAAPDSVQVTVAESGALSAMNISDFAPNLAPPSGAAVRRAFRTHEGPGAIRVEVAEVLPEIRVEEKGSLSVSDERIVLATQLKVAVARAGLFSLSLLVPPGFDMESLSGQEVSHWDEIQEPARAVVVHFSKPVLGARELNVVLVRLEKGIGETLVVPKIAVSNALKHTGVLVVSSERGVRLTTLQREGVSEVNPRELDLRQPGVLAFSLLRPDWSLVLKTDVLSPVLKPDVLHRVDVTEGLLKGRVYIRYRIENAGCKVFTLQAPQADLPLSIAGADIAKVQAADPARGLWRVTLHNKVEQTYALQASYQAPFELGAREAVVKPVRLLDTEPPRGYLAVLSDGRAQVRPQGEPADLKPEDARGLPALFGAGDLSDAVLCYRTIQPDYELSLSVLRHETAAALPVRVTGTRLVSVLSGEGRLLTRLTLDLQGGALRYLDLSLPDRDATLWAAFVNGRAAPPVREDGVFRIPLEAVEPGEPVTVEAVYDSRAGGSWLARRIEGPRVNVPLNDIRWSVYVLPNRFYYGFGGTLECADAGRVLPALGFDEQAYRRNTEREILADAEKAKQIMAQGEQYARQGRQQLAKKSLESAIQYSQGQRDLNEDARVQYRNLIQVNAVSGLVSRRAALRQFQNIQTEPQPNAPPVEQAARPREAPAPQALSPQDSDVLRGVSEKMIRQQEAAAGLPQAIRVTIPEHGRRLEFRRTLQIDPQAPMEVAFKAVGVGAAARALAGLAATAAAALAAWALCRGSLYRGHP